MRIGEHVSEKLDVKPLSFFCVPRRVPAIRLPAGRTHHGQTGGAGIIDRGLAAPGLPAQVAIHKYADHLPLYRQEAILVRHGVTISRTTTLAEWICVMGLCLQLVVDALHRRLLQAPES